jgi:hypothetical protein
MSGWSLDYDDDIAIAAEYVLGLLPTCLPGQGGGP